MLYLVELKNWEVLALCGLCFTLGYFYGDTIRALYERYRRISDD